MICIFSVIVHSLRWIQDTFQGTICAVEVETDDYSLNKACRKTPLQASLDNLKIEADKLRKTVRQFEDFEKSLDK
jgi:hypothetical protein